MTELTFFFFSFCIVPHFFIIFFFISHHNSKRRGGECEGSALSAPVLAAVGDDTVCFLLAFCSDQEGRTDLLFMHISLCGEKLIWMICREITCKQLDQYISFKILH